jgi:hypothetical protein
MHRPHLVNPSLSSIRLIIVYKNFAANKGISHIGLGVSAMNTAQTLNSHNIWTEVWPAKSVEDLTERLAAEQDKAYATGRTPVSHVVISAPWIPTSKLQQLLMAFTDVHFAVSSHSNVGFLMADPQGIKLLREAGDLQLSHHNFNLAGNSRKFARAWTHMYGTEVQWLPNLYNVDTSRSVGERIPWDGGILRVGIFGAVRPLKNMVSAVAAAIELSSRLRTDVEIWMSAGRAEGGHTAENAIKQLVDGLINVKLVHSGWQSWPGFRKVVSKMHLLMQPSYTESFNMVTADGIVEGVASVVSDAIDWAPEDWVAKADDVDDISRTALRLLTDQHAVNEGQRALKEYVTNGIISWKSYLLYGYDGCE